MVSERGLNPGSSAHSGSNALPTWATSSLWEIRRARCCFVRKMLIKRKPTRSWHYLPKVVLTIIKNRNIVLTTDVNRTISNFSSKNCFEEINGLNRKCNILTHRLTYHLWIQSQVKFGFKYILWSTLHRGEVTKNWHFQPNNVSWVMRHCQMWTKRLWL